MKTSGAIDRISDLMSNFMRDTHSDPLFRLRTRVGRVEQQRGFAVRDQTPLTKRKHMKKK
jgi:hypothetical protein